MTGGNVLRLFCLIVVAYCLNTADAQVCIINSQECGGKQICISNLCTSYPCKTSADCAGITHDEAYGLKLGCTGGLCALQQKAKRAEGLDDASMIRLIKRIVASGKKR